MVARRSAALNLPGRYLRAFDIEREYLVVGFAQGFDHRRSGTLRGLDETGGNLALKEDCARGVAYPLERTHIDQIHDPGERIFESHGDLGKNGMRLDAVPNLLHATPWICAQTIALVDKCDARDAVLVGLAPHGFGLRFDPANRTKHGHRAVEHAQAAFDLDRKVDVAGGIDDVHAMLAPEAGRRGGRDADAALLLLLHPVHDSGAIVNFTHGPRHAGIEEDALGGRGFPRIDMRHDPDVAGMIYGNLPSHDLFLFRARVDRLTGFAPPGDHKVRGLAFTWSRIGPGCFGRLEG